MHSLLRYRPAAARQDVVAGITVAALAVPAALAYAELAGISPTAGLYALLLPAVAYALLGSSTVLIVGPEGSVSALVAAAVLPLAAAGSAGADERAAALAVMVAACYLLAWVLRLGWLSDYLSRPVLIGYLHGIAVVLVVSQLPKMLGLSVGARDPVPQLAEMAGKLGQISWLTLGVGVVSLAALLVLRQFVPWLPAQLIVVVAAIAVSWALDLEAHGVAVVGTIPSGLPSIGLPAPPAVDYLKLAPAALGIFFLSFADAILTVRSFAAKRGEHVRTGQELLAFGVANAAAGITQTFPVGASNSRTAVNDAMKARTQVSSLVAAGAVLCIVLFATAPLAHLPKAVLGAVIISAALGLVELDAWRRLAATDRVEVAIAAVTTAGVVAIGVLEAVVMAVGLTIVDVVRRSARPHDAVLGWVEELGRYADVSIHTDARLTPGVVVYRPDDRIFFANAQYVKGRVLEAVHGAPWPVRWLVLDAEAVTNIDSSGLEALDELVSDLRELQVGIAVARLKDAARRQLDDAGISDAIGADHFYGSVHAAVAACAT